MQQRKVSRAHVFNPAIRPRAPHHQRGVLPRGGAVAKEPVGQFHQSLQRELLACQAAKRRVQMAHQHGRRYAFSSDIPEQKQERPIGFDQVAVIAADQSCRLVMVARLPPGARPVAGRQKCALDARRERQIVFQGALLVAGEVIQAKTQQRVAQQAVRFDGPLAGLANPECATLKLGKSAASTLASRLLSD